MASFEKNCVADIRPNRKRMEENLGRSLMQVTCLSPQISYTNASRCAHKAFEENTTLKEAVLSLGFMSAEEYDEQIRDERMCLTITCYFYTCISHGYVKTAILSGKNQEKKGWQALE